ncbi:MAG TPA: vanadium-dependent haloperoxidase [Thermoanaerobaculia bacterium]|nr:vanadium-dependent haloperoxidase [Thermoanaerobaculia bacterium]
MKPNDRTAGAEPARPFDPGCGRGISRRGFLGGVGGAAAALAVGPGALEPLAFAAGASPAASATAATAASGAPEIGHGAGGQRREAAYQYRLAAARAERDVEVPRQAGNGDEERYPSRIGCFSKALPHNAFGEADPAAYDALIKALRSGDPDRFEEVPLGAKMRLASPLSGLAYDLEGTDSCQLSIPPAPALACAEAAGEQVEVYWMALLRDVAFDDYATDPAAHAAAANLNALSAFKGPRQGGAVTAQTLFRDDLPGASAGPYLSQFMVRSTQFGAEYLVRQVRTFLPGSDYLTRYDDWLAAQNGAPQFKVQYDPVRRYIRNGRDLAAYVRLDMVYQAYLAAFLILAQAPDPGDVLTGGGIACPNNSGNPYARSKTMGAACTFGAPHCMTLLAEVANRALKAVFYQKWYVHRRLRPEAYAGLVHHQLTAKRYPAVLHDDLLGSLALARVRDKHGSYLLPQAYPEGSPPHPSYAQAHSSVGGACVTVLKAMFEERYPMPDPKVVNRDGSTLLPYTGPTLTVGGELNKLASNVATGRNIAGIHYRSDAIEGLKLGEAVAISILRDQKAGFPEKFSGFTFTKFDGTKVTV